MERCDTHEAKGRAAGIPAAILCFPRLSSAQKFAAAFLWLNIAGGVPGTYAVPLADLGRDLGSKGTLEAAERAARRWLAQLSKAGLIRVESISAASYVVDIFDPAVVLAGGERLGYRKTDAPIQPYTSRTTLSDKVVGQGCRTTLSEASPERAAPVERVEKNQIETGQEVSDDGRAENAAAAPDVARDSRPCSISAASPSTKTPSRISHQETRPARPDRSSAPAAGSSAGEPKSLAELLPLALQQQVDDLVEVAADPARKSREVERLTDYLEQRVADPNTSRVMFARTAEAATSGKLKREYLDEALASLDRRRHRNDPTVGPLRSPGAWFFDKLRTVYGFEAGRVQKRMFCE